MTQRSNLPGERATRARSGDAAVGIDATGLSESDLYRIILRADFYDFSLVVGYRDGSSLDAVRIAAQAGAVITDLADADDAQSSLRLAAENAGFDRLLWHPTPSAPIDFEESVRQLRSTDEYVVTSSTQGDADGVGVMVAIPAYNEAGTVADVVTETSEYADEVVVVDDGSDDATSERAGRTDATVVEHETNRGYGAALKTAFEEAAARDADHLVVLDADGQHDPSDVPKLVEAQRESGAQLVIGNRFMDESGTTVPRYRRVGLFVVNLLTNVGLGTVVGGQWIDDTQSGFRAYDRAAIQSLAEDDSIGDGMNASTDIIYHAHDRDYAVEEVPTTIDYDIENANSQNPVSHGIVLVSNLLHVLERERPITLIGIPGFAAASVGLGLVYVALLELFRTGTVSVGVSILAVLLAFVGILACFSAIILHSIQVHIDS